MDSAELHKLNHGVGGRVDAAGSVAAAGKP